MTNAIKKLFHESNRPRPRGGPGAEARPTTTHGELESLAEPDQPDRTGHSGQKRNPAIDLPITQTLSLMKKVFSSDTSRGHVGHRSLLSTVPYCRPRKRVNSVDSEHCDSNHDGDNNEKYYALPDSVISDGVRSGFGARSIAVFTSFSFCTGSQCGNFFRSCCPAVQRVRCGDGLRGC